GGNRSLVELFGTRDHWSRPRAGEGCAGRSCAQCRLLPDRRRSASARASHRRKSTAGRKVTPMAPCPRGGRLLRTPLPAHGRFGGGSASFRCWVGSLGNTGTPWTSAPSARK